MGGEGEAEARKRKGWETRGRKSRRGRPARGRRGKDVEKGEAAKERNECHLRTLKCLLSCLNS